LIYNFITKNRNSGISPDLHIPPGGLVSKSEVEKIFPQVKTDGLQGGAIWYDGFVEDSPRLIIEVLRIACSNGATVMNYFEAQELEKVGNQVVGVSAIDCESKKVYKFSSENVVNNTGPWCRDLAGRFDRDIPALFRSMIAWNILFDREAISNHGVAVKSDQTSHTYFLVPWKGQLLAGTGHASWNQESRTPSATQKQINNFISDLNHAIPGLNLQSHEISYVLPGLQSATKAGGTSLAKKDVIVDHGKQKGPQGLFSVSGVKLTTSRLVAERTLKLIFGIPTNQLAEDSYKIPQNSENDCWSYTQGELPTDNDWNQILHSIVRGESVIHLDDLFYRRTTLWEDPKRVTELAQHICQMLDWEKSRSNEEIKHLANLVSNNFTIL
jgi:glycerol-3-phosphate dehydrogenase